MTKPMKIIALYNEKGGVGSTSLAAHLCWLARENGIRVAGISFDPTTELRGWIEPLGISWFDGLRHQEPDECAELLVADIHGQTRNIVLEPDLWVIPIEGRMSYENAIGLSDRLSGPILWLPNHIHGASFFVRYEVPPSLRRVEQLFPGVPRSHAIADAGAERRQVWGTDEGARSPGARYLRSALEAVLERSGVRWLRWIRSPPSGGSELRRRSKAVAAIDRRGGVQVHAEGRHRPRRWGDGFLPRA